MVGVQKALKKRCFIKEITKVLTLRRVFEGRVSKHTCFFDGGTSGEDRTAGTALLPY